MRYISKTADYDSPNEAQGRFSNAWVETGKRTIVSDVGEEFFTVDFHLKYMKDTTVVKIASSSESFGEKQPTLIRNENEEPEDIRDYLLRGGVYDKDKIIDWGRPSFYGVQEYFNIDTIWGDIQLTDQEPFRSIAKDWIDNNIRIQGVLIKESFELEVLD